MTQPRVETAEFWTIPGMTAERRVAARDAWAAFWSSRAVVWGAGIVAIVVFGWSSGISSRLDPLFLTLPFDDPFANLLVAPGARFDAAWYLAIAEHGYGVSGRAAFFPVFPGLTALGGALIGSTLVAGVLISSACSLGALYLLHRLVTLDFDPERARTVVWLMAWFPSAMVLSAVYTEGLFLLVSIGSLYAARLGHWPVAGALGAVAAASRSSGLLLLVPLLIIYLYGPRADRPGRVVGSGIRPRHPVRADLVWVVGAVPAGLLAYLAYLGIATGDPVAAFSAQEIWHRTFVPLGGIALGIWSALDGALELLIPGVGTGGVVSPELLALRDIALLGFLAAGLWLVHEASKRLPAAYTAYAACGLALPLSVPAAGYPLMSLPRFMFVLFPLWIALALWAHERDRVRPVIGVFGTLLAISTILFVTWSLAP
jgi:mannosyltransferase PIG-V